MSGKVKGVIFSLLGSALGMSIGYIKNNTIKVIFISILVAIFIGMLVRDRIRWIQNNKIIGDKYIRFKSNMNVEIILFLLFCWGIFRLYSVEKKNIYIETGKEGLTSFAYYLTNMSELSWIILFFSGAMLLLILFGIINKHMCPPKISSEGILFTEGMFLTFDKIEKIAVESSMTGYTKKVKIYFDKGYRVVKTTKEKYQDIRKILMTNCSTSIEEDSICKSEF